LFNFSLILPGAYKLLLFTPQFYFTKLKWLYHNFATYCTTTACH